MSFLKLPQMTIALGNNKPEPLLEVERIIWKTLFVLSEGLHVPEDVVEQLLVQIPWEHLQCLDPSQRSWFNICAPPLPHIAPAPTLDVQLTQTTSLPTPPSFPAPALPDHVDMTLDHEAQGSAHDPDAMDTQPDGNELRSTEKLTDDCAGIDEEIPPCDPTKELSSQGQAETQRRSASVDRQPQSPSIGEDGGADLQSQFPQAMAFPQPGLQSSSDMAEDLASSKVPSETIVTRRSAHLNSKEKSQEERGAERRVPSTLGTWRSRTGNRGKATKPKQMSPDNSSRSASPIPPVLKRKEPPEVEDLLSAGSSISRPIDVDALDAVLERFPVKYELQVSNCKMPHPQPTDFFQYVKQEIGLSDLQQPVRRDLSHQAKPP